MAWLETQTFEERGTMEAKLCYLEQIKHLRRSIAELDAAIEEVAMSLERSDVVKALCAFKGIKVLTAATFLAEIGDFKRFATASQFMSFLGLTPSESSSGETTKRGAITKAGNGRLRRLLVESAWTYTKAPHESQELKRRAAGVHQDVKDIAMKAQKRLWRRRSKMLAAQKAPRKVTVALARELAGFIWSAALQENLVTEAA
jgi:transposase